MDDRKRSMADARLTHSSSEDYSSTECVPDLLHVYDINTQRARSQTLPNVDLHLLKARNSLLGRDDDVSVQTSVQTCFSSASSTTTTASYETLSDCEHYMLPALSVFNIEVPRPKNLPYDVCRWEVTGEETDLHWRERSLTMPAENVRILATKMRKTRIVDSYVSDSSRVKVFLFLLLFLSAQIWLAALKKTFVGVYCNDVGLSSAGRELSLTQFALEMKNKMSELMREFRSSVSFWKIPGTKSSRFL